ncbi:MAG: OmpA family protein [Pseudobdellovibrionaceae bacterium]
MNIKKFLTTLIPLFVSGTAFANVCGTDYQNFNPTTNGLDFVTVQSSETLRPCIINMGLFFNYAVNSLTYSKTLNANFKSGQKRKDSITGADLSIGMGLTDRWDFGVNVPFLLSRSVEDDYYVASFEKNGATEIRANTKYRLLGDANGGLAAVFSVNNNLVEDNPFIGKNAGPIFNYEFVADTVFASKWAAALNVGYRDRNPGDPIAGVPFVPMDDQWTYSVAGSYLLDSVDTKLIFEIFGSQPAKNVELDTDRSLSSLEALMGAKYDYSQNVALHFGGAHQIDTALGGAEWRVYAGINWAVGPVCGNEEKQVAIVQPATPQDPEVIKIDVEVLFRLNSDELDPEKMVSIDLVVLEAIKTSYDRFLIEGHTDSIGSEEYNQDLSERRAAAMHKHLIDKLRVAANKVEAKGFGETMPIADNGNYQGRRQNRRVELKIWRPR